MRHIKQFLVATAIALFCSLGVSADTIFDDDFSTASDGSLGSVSGWEGQGNWTVAGGMATGNGSWQRARRFAGFRTEDGESFEISLTNFALTGNGGTSEQFRVGAAATPEHTGASTPMVAIGFLFDGSSLAVGGATDSGYDSGDTTDITLNFSRAGADWSVDATINNTTDGTSFSGSIAALNGAGATGGANGLTTSQWLDADPGNELYFGMRMWDNGAGDTVTLSGVKLETFAVPEPTSLALLGTFGIGLFTRRRRS